MPRAQQSAVLGKEVREAAEGGICLLARAPSPSPPPGLLTKGDSLGEVLAAAAEGKAEGWELMGPAAADEQVASQTSGPREPLKNFCFNSSPSAFSKVHFIVSLCFFSLSSSFEQTEQNKHDL